MQVIAGELGRMKIKEDRRAEFHPMGERVRGALFNILGERVRGARMLDLCAGTGAVGLEAVSRGADFVGFVERDRLAFQVLKANLLEAEKRLGRGGASFGGAVCSELCGDGLGLSLKSDRGKRMWAVKRDIFKMFASENGILGISEMFWQEKLDKNSNLRDFLLTFYKKCDIIVVDMPYEVFEGENKGGLLNTEINQLFLQIMEWLRPEGILVISAPKTIEIDSPLAERYDERKYAGASLNFFKKN